MKPLCKRVAAWVSREGGVALMMFLFTLPVLLGLTSLAIDTANLLMARQVVNKVARVSAASGLNIRGLNGWASLVTDEADYLGRKTGGKDPDISIDSKARKLVSDTMIAVATQHLRAYFPSDTSSVDQYFEVSDGATWYNLYSDRVNFETTLRKSLKLKGLTDDTSNSSDEQIRVKYRYRVRTLFACSFARLLGVSLLDINCGTNENRVYVKSDDIASGKLAPANIYVLLDTSASMGVGTDSGGKTKKQRLDEAMATFVDYFNPYKDKISIIPFGHAVKSGGTPLGNFTAFAADSGHLAVKKTIKDLPTAGFTNHCDALISAIQPIRDNPTGPNFVILFTDGAPNAYRLKFCSGTTNNPDCITEPAKLNVARGGVDPDLGWYGTQMIWGRRQVRASRFPPTINNPKDYDPVFGQPLFTSSGSPVPDDVTIDQNLQFRKPPFGYGALTSTNPRWTMQFDKAEPNNYKWVGPTYLVYSNSQAFGNQTNIEDRIVTASLNTNVITCGTPGRRANDPTKYDINEQYNHSRYFATRVVDSNWSLDRTVDGVKQRQLVGLDKLFPKEGDVPEISWLRDSSISISGGDPKTHPLPTTTSPGCLTTLNSVVPQTGNSARILVGDSFISNTAPATSVNQVGEIVKTAELPYYCAVRAADYLRSLNAVVFVVGLGPAAEGTYGATCNDPMQNPLDFSSRKDYFLRRVAFAPESLENPVQFIGRGDGTGSNWAPQSDFTYRTVNFAQCTNHPLNPTTGSVSVTTGYAEDPFNPAPNSTAGRQPAGHGFTPAHLGAYYGSNDPSQLNALFAKIAKQILTRLSS